MRSTLQASFYDIARRNPRRRALGFYSSAHELSWLTNTELHDRGFRAAGWLGSEGLRRGDTCLLVLADARRCAILLLGVLALGAVPLVIAPPAIQGGSRLQARILRATARRTRARLIVTDESLDEPDVPFDPGRSRVCTIGQSLDPPQGAAIDPAIPPARAVVAYQLTSGTTGFPRVCVWRQRGVVGALTGMRSAMRLRDDDLCVNWTPLYHDMGLVNNLFLCLASGVPLVLANPVDFVRRPALWLRALSETRATQTWSPNFGFALATERATDEELAGVRLDSVRAFWNAAERIHVETILSFHRRFGPLGVALAALKTNFGCAENVGGATFSDVAGRFVVERVRASTFFERGVAEPASGSSLETTLDVVSAGRPVPGTLIAIFRRGKRVPDGHVGELALATPTRMDGYLLDARSTRSAVRGRYLMTGDLGYTRGREFFWTGRSRERITIRGGKFDPSDFERVLSSMPELRRGCFAVFGVDDATRGTQKVVVLAEIRNETVDVDSIARRLRAGVLLDCGVALDDVVIVPRGSLTKTTSGKRRHSAHREPYLAGAFDTLRMNRET